MSIECLSVDCQLNELKKYISFHNKIRIKAFLLNKGYYRISRYAKVLSSKFEDEGKPNVSDLIAFYDLDRKLRLLFLKAIKEIEIKFRNSISLTITQKSLNNFHIYLREDFYTSSKGLNNKAKRDKVKKAFNHFFNDIIEKENRIRNSHKYADFSSFKPDGKYEGEKLPIWIFLEYVDFGTVVSMYEYLPLDIQKLVLKNYYNFSKVSKETTLIMKDWINAIRGLRNKAAHYNRLIGTTGTLIKPYNNEKSEIVLRNSADLFSRIYALLKIMDSKNVKLFKSEMLTIFKKYEKVSKNLVDMELLPIDWENTISQIDPVLIGG